MNISPVSFSGTAASTQSVDFSELVHRPQLYRQGEDTLAVTGLRGKEKKSIGKKVAAGVAVAAGVVVAAAAGLAYAAKTGKLVPGTNEALNKIIEPLAKAGNFIADKAAPVIQSVKGMFSKGAEVSEDAIEKTIDTVQENAQKLIEAAT